MPRPKTSAGRPWRGWKVVSASVSIGWRDQLLDLRAQIEANLDFSDEGDVGDILPDSFVDGMSDLFRPTLSVAMAGIEGGRIVREGLRVALAGPPNAGKSSLLNALAKSDIAIVTDEAGTTRDVREVPIDLNGQFVIMLDLAGLARHRQQGGGRRCAPGSRGDGTRRSGALAASARC